MSLSVYAIATMDTKGHELAYVAERLRAVGLAVLTVDVSTKEAAVVVPDVTRETVADNDPTTAARVVALCGTDRGEAITAMGKALTSFLLREYEAGRMAGLIGIGGSGNTALITPAMQALPIGLPKVMVSTIASGNVAPYVGTSDILMIYPVVDVAGLNAVSRRVLGNAAHALAGMIEHPLPASGEKRTVAMTMFGVTTPCVTAAREALESRGFDVLVFHATGTGGRAMEKLVEAGLVHGVLDITTTEVADEVVGGILPAGPHRFEAILRARIPYVLSLGALDMVNFGAMDTVPERFRRRKLQVHNAQVTLMRTTAEENRRFARWIAAKLNRAEAPFTLLIPEGGVSALDASGQPFFDPEADAALFKELESAIEPGTGRTIRRLPLHINEPAFVQTIVESYLELDDSRARTDKVGPVLGEHPTERIRHA
jgi:uncharacterized protein (UPF0261 family)